VKRLHFKHRRHEETFRALWQKAGQPTSPDRVAALYVLAATGKPVDQYVAVEYPDEIAFDQLFEAYGAWSSGEKALAKLAGHLFNAYWPVTVDDALGNLDENNRQVAFEALRMRYPY
jgi:hypothetical protein